MPRGQKSSVGDETVAQNGYTYVHTEAGWRLKHHIVAEEKYGRPLESNERATFKDGDRTNFASSNIVIAGIADKKTPYEKVRKRLLRLEMWKDRVDKEVIELREMIEELDPSRSNDGQIESNNGN